MFSDFAELPWRFREPDYPDPDYISHICDNCLECYYAKYQVDTKYTDQKKFCGDRCKALWEEENKHDYVDDEPKGDK